MRKLTPELEAKIKASGTPIIRVSPKELLNVKVADKSYINKKLKNPLNK